MPTFRQDEKLGTKVPLIKTADFNDKSVTTEKLAEGSVTNSKLAPESVTQDKFDKELLQIFKAAAGLPENLIETIQNVDSTLVDHQRQISSNDDDISDLQTKTKQIKDTLDGIAVSGGASVGSAVTYDNTQSGLDAQNIQNAIDELVNNLGHYETNEEWLRVYTDAENKFLWGIRVDGSIDWAVGIPRPIQKKIEELIATDTSIQESITQLRTELTESINNKIRSLKDNEIKNLQDTKVDKEEGKSLIEDEVKECFRVIENEEFIHTVVDAEDKLLFGFQWDGTPVFGKTSVVEDRLQEQVNLLADKITTILGDDDTTSTIDTLKELKKFFAEIENTETLTGILANLDNIAKNLDKTTIKDEEGNVQDTPFRVIENEEFIKAIVDSEDRILFGLYRATGKPYYPLNDMYHVEQNEEFLWVVLDEANHPLLGIRKDGSVDWASGIPSPIRKELSDLHRKTNLPEVINRNRIQESRVYAAVRWNANTKAKDLQFCLVGDPHDPYSKATQNAVEVTNYFRSIDAMIVLGDIQGWTPYDTSLKDRYGIKPFVDILDKCIKPWYLVVGNHDVGPCRYIPFARSHQQVWEDLIKPMVDRGFLRSNEVNSSNDYASKCYYYHDFNNYKVRLIVLYEYGFPLELEDSNEYWETIDYDESAVDMQLDTTYTYDANNPIVCNCSRYKEHSFKLKKSVTTPHITTENDGKIPQYKFRNFSFFTKEQMEWLASVLLDTPDGYGVIIASHQSLVAPSTLTNNKFSRGITPDNVSPRQDGLSADMAMNMAIVPKIVDAWIKKKSVSERVVATYRNIPNDGNPEYLNTETDSDGKYAYKLNLDFSNRINNNAYFINYIAAHEHNDSIEQSVDYPSQKDIIVTTPNPPYRWMSDIATVDDPNCQAYDSLTIYSCNKDRIALVKYGDDITINGIKRDFEIIKL